MGDGTRDDHRIIFYVVARCIKSLSYRIDYPMWQTLAENLGTSPVEIHNLH